MDKSLENLQTCIEKYTINTVSGPTTYYYDTRFGTQILDRILHPSYKKCFSSTVQPVKEVKTIVRDENNFHLCIVSNDASANSVCIQIMVRFYPADKTFICRDYDPTVIIPAILASDAKDYLKNKDHPFYRFGYIADYSWHPIDLQMDYKYLSAIEQLREREELFGHSRSMYNRMLLQNTEEAEIAKLTNQINNPPKPPTPPKKSGLAFTNELDWYDSMLDDSGSNESAAKSDEKIDIADLLRKAKDLHGSPTTSSSGERDNHRVQEPHSDCDSCGHSVFGVDDPDESLPTITADDIKELDALFNTYTREECEEPEEILNTMNLRDSMIEDKFRIPRLPLHKLRFNPVNPSPEDIEHQKMVQEQARQRNLELIRLRELQQLMATMEAYKPISKDLIPKIETRDDNLDWI